MKKVIGMLALVALVGNIANAELLKNFKHEGKIEVNAYATGNNADGNSDTKDKTSDVDTRVQLNMGFDLTQDVNAVVSVIKNDRQYGNGSQNATGATGILDVVKFEQAYLNLTGVLGFDHKVGRQYYGNEGDLVVYAGPTNWPYQPYLPVTALDGYTGWYKTGKWDLHAVLGKTGNNNAAPPATITDTADIDVTGIVGKYDLMEEVKLGAYVYEQKTYNNVAVKDLTLDVVGVKAMGNVKGIEYNAELAMNYGHAANAATDKNYAGSAFLANAKYGMDLAGKIEFMGEFAMGSGNDKTTDKKNKAFYSIASDYRPGILWGGFNGAAGLNNSGVADTGLTTWNIGAKWNPEFSSKLSLSAKLINLAPTEDKVDGTSIGYDTVGNEFDLSAKWMHSENVNLKAYFAYFMPDKDFSTTMGGTNDDAATLIGAGLNVKF